MGRVSLAGGCDAWVHAASLGEAQAAGPLARSLLALAPDARLWLTAQTRTGRARLAELGLRFRSRRSTRRKRWRASSPASRRAWC
jgi:hypothetical protein